MGDNIKELNPFPKEGNVYGVVSNIENLINDGYSVSIDLINEEMIKFDNAYIFSDNLNLSKNPKENLYIYFATLNINEKQYGENFVIQDTDEFYEYKIYEKDYCENKYEVNDKLIECNIYFSASPIIEKSYYIERIKKIFKLPIVIPPFKNSALNDVGDIKNKLDTIFVQTLQTSCFTVHNVGQGSCNTVDFNLHLKLFYDIGISKYVNKDKHYGRYISTYSKFKFDKYSAVIISHWDHDHYAGLYHDKDGNILRKTWIVPDFGINPNLLRIAYIIDNYGSLVRISNSLHGLLYEKDDLFLFKGDGTDKNDKGIILAVNSIKKLVAMGDVSYDCSKFIAKYVPRSASEKIFEKIDFFIVPHHGADVPGDVPFKPQTSVLRSGLKRPSDAIISVGYNQPNYDHPRTNSIVKLTDKGFRIVRTDTDGRIRIIFR